MVQPTNTTPLKARLFRALADEPRLTVAEELAHGEQRVSDLAQRLHMSQSSVSTHLAALHAGGAVVRRAEGRQAYYGFAHPTVGRLLQDAEEIVVAAVQDAYVCSRECCMPTAPSIAGAPQAGSL
jgi:DNA-binding transcriptional ArsR family regulator